MPRGSLSAAVFHARLMLKNTCVLGALGVERRQQAQEVHSAWHFVIHAKMNPRLLVSSFFQNLIKNQLKQEHANTWLLKTRVFAPENIWKSNQLRLDFICCRSILLCGQIAIVITMAVRT